MSEHKDELLAVALEHCQSYARNGSTYPMARRKEVRLVVERLADLEAELAAAREAIQEAIYSMEELLPGPVPGPGVPNWICTDCRFDKARGHKSNCVTHQLRAALAGGKGEGE